MNDDTISRKAVIDTVHAAVRPFIANDGDEMNDADKMVLSINKAVCNAIKALPTAPNTSNALSALDCVERQAALDCFHDWIDKRGDVHTADEMPEYSAIEALPSVQPESTIGQLNTDGQSTKMDVISRRAVIDALDALCDRECEYSKKQRSFMCGACRLGSAFDVIDELPSIQPQRMRGKWIPQGWNDTYCKCSCCDAMYVTAEIPYNYCPNCGADMRGTANDD